MKPAKALVGRKPSLGKGISFVSSLPFSSSSSNNGVVKIQLGVYISYLSRYIISWNPTSYYAPQIFESVRASASEWTWTYLDLGNRLVTQEPRRLYLPVASTVNLSLMWWQHHWPLGTGVVKLVVTAIFVFWGVETLGRKLSLFISAMGMGTLFYIIGALLKTHPPPPVVDGQPPLSPPPPSQAMAAMLYIYVLFYSMGWGRYSFVLYSS